MRPAECSVYIKVDTKK
ncbi:hypothetical protein [secondary endosymbiont of Ctenarytaina eucalypti]